MELATIAKAASATIQRIKEKSQDENSSMWIVGISGLLILTMLPMAFMCCVFSSMSSKGAVAGNDGGVSYFKAIFSIPDENGGELFSYTATTQEEAADISYIINLFNTESNFFSDNIIGAGSLYTGNISLLLQWDSRWGNNSYGNSTIAKGGCGPTCLAMIINSFGGSVTPTDIANYSVKAGYRVDGVGTAWGLFTSGASNFGLNGNQIGISVNNIKSALKNGNPIIASMTKGHFTNSGHFIVIADCNEDGTQVYIQDPNSEEKSRWWNTNIVMSESVAMWSFAYNG